MFGKKKEVRRPQKSDDPFGFDLMGGFDPMAGGNGGDDDNDDDLEAELHQLMMDDNPPPKRPARRAPPPPVPINLEVTDDVGNGSDEELSGDDDDPELLSELNAIMGEDGSLSAEHPSSPPEEPIQPSMPTANQEEIITLLEERLELYNLAETKAKNNNEISKARRFSRGIKTLQGMIRDAKVGKDVNSADIPPPLPRSATQMSDNSAEEGQHNENGPEVASDETNPTPVGEVAPELSPASESNPTPLEEAASQSSPTSAPIVDEEKMDLLKQRQQEYKIAAVGWKKSGNLEEAVKCIKIAKQFDIVIAALASGQPVDLSDMPASPKLPGPGDSVAAPVQNEAEKVENETQSSQAPEEAETPQASITGDGITGALKERLEIYRKQKTAAEEEGNSSKARRYGRICKQYEDAIKLHGRGKPIPVDELPVPPGMPPIVVNLPAPAPSTPLAPPRKAVEREVPGEDQPTPPPRGQKKPVLITSRAQKQTVLLQKRQAELKRAALMAKKDGDLELARDYLRQAKGMDPLIRASEGGLPVDMTSIPLSPNNRAELGDAAIDANSMDSFALVSSDECQPVEATGTDTEIYDNLEKQLIRQKKTCLATRDHAKALGDVPGYNRWERMALGFSSDVDMLRVRRRDGLPPPQHHYEEKTYAIVQSCTDLNDADVEISIIRGVNYPKEGDTYVMYEFPYPSDRTPQDRTSTIRNTSNPEYEATFTLTGSADRSSRQCQRTFKRHALKCQVWSKGCSMNPLMWCLHPRGFLRSDSLLGTATVKLQPLETHCILHDSFPLMNGRKAIGGKLEVKIRLRNPIATKQIDKMTDRWLVIDN